MKSLPEPPDDYAKIWWTEHNDSDIRPRLIEYNAYLQAFEDLENGTLKIAGIDGKELVDNIRRHVRDDFRKHSMEYFRPNNDYHRALYAARVKSYMQMLKNGVFTGPKGLESTKPEVAEAFEDYVNEIFEDQILESEKQYA